MKHPELYDGKPDIKLFNNWVHSITNYTNIMRIHEHTMICTKHTKVKINKWLTVNMFMCTQWIPTILSVNLLPFNVNVGGSNILCSHQGTYLMRIDDKDYATTPLTSIGGLNASYNCPFQSTTTFQPDRPTEILIMPFLWLALGFMRYTHSCFWSRLLTCHYLIQGPDC